MKAETDHNGPAAIEFVVEPEYTMSLAYQGVPGANVVIWISLFTSNWRGLV